VFERECVRVSVCVCVFACVNVCVCVCLCVHAGVHPVNKLQSGKMTHLLHTNYTYAHTHAQKYTLKREQVRVRERPSRSMKKSSSSSCTRASHLFTDDKSPVANACVRVCMRVCPCVRERDRERETVCGSEGGKVKRKRERTMGGEQTREKECVSVSA